MSKVDNFKGVAGVISARERKEVLAFRADRRDAGLDIRPGEVNEEKTRLWNTTLALLKEASDLKYEDLKALERIADSPFFALSEIERFHTHMHTVHNGKTEECDNGNVVGCFEDYNMEDSKDFMCTMVIHLREWAEAEEAKGSNGI